jgi:translation initiation factor IF-2
VRALISEEGTRPKEAPLRRGENLGLNGVPEAGLEFSVLEDEKVARDLADQRAQELRGRNPPKARAKVTLENLFATLDATQAKALKVVVKADTQGSVEAIVEALKKIEAAWFRWKSSTAPSAPSPNRTCCWPRLPRHHSWLPHAH